MAPGLAVLLLCALASLAHAACDDGWSTGAPMGIPRQELGVAALGGEVYAVGGFDAIGPSPAAEVYDPSTDQWRPIAALPVAVHHPGAAVAGGTLYLIGGLAGAGFTALDTVLAHDAVGDAWLPRASLPAPRGAMGLAVVDDRIYVAGGLRGGASVADFAVYEPATDTWTPLPAMPTARDHLAAAAIGGHVYAVGGRAGGQLFGALEAFDPATSAWRTLAPMPTPRGGLAAAALGARLFTFGGEGNPASPLGIFAETEGYDVAADRWLAHPPMPTPRHGMMAAAIDGAVVLPGGAVRQGFGVSGVTETFSPPSTGVVDGLRARRRGTRLRLRGRIDGAGVTLGTAPLTVEVADDAGPTLATLALPAGARAVKRLRHRAPRGTVGITALTLRPGRRQTLRIRVRATLAAGVPSAITLTLALGEARHCGSAPVGGGT